MSAQQEKYAFTRDFESAIALAAVSAPRFHDLVGHALDPDKMPSADAALCIRAAQAVALQMGSGCPASTLAVQYLRTQSDKGKLTMEQVNGARALLESAVDLGASQDVDALVTAVLPVVKRIAQREAIGEMIKDFGQGGEAEESLRRMEKVAGLGKQRGTVGQLLKGTAEDIRAAAAHSIRSPLATGVPELDSVLDGGGMERAALGVAIGGPGAGKSLYLCGLAAAAMVEGHDVAYMSLELSEQQVKKRIYANLYDMTAEDMAAHPEKAAHRHQALKGDGVGNMHVIYDTAGATTPSTYKTWLRSLERDNPGFKPEVLIVDYADLMVSSSRKNDMRMYEEMKIVYEQLRSIAVERDCWIWTASQAARGGLHKKRLDLEHIADSINKARIADIVVSIARTSEDEAQGMVRFRVPKRREGAAHSEIGPLTMDASHGRMVMMARRNPW